METGVSVAVLRNLSNRAVLFLDKQNKYVKYNIYSEPCLIMNNRCLLFGALFFLVFATIAPGGEPTPVKNPKNPPPPVIPPPPVLRLPMNRIGVMATGGFNVETEFVSDAFVKKDPSKPKGFSDSDSDSDEDDFSGGFEVFYERLFTQPDVSGLWGLRVGVGYNEFELEGLSGVLDQKLDADLFYLSVGPFYEYRFTNQFYGQLGAGLTAAYISSDLSSEDLGGVFDDDASEDDFLFGAYASVALGYDFTPHWGIIGGVRYQYLDSHEIKTESGEAELDFDGSFYAFLGLRFTF